MTRDTMIALQEIGMKLESQLAVRDIMDEFQISYTVRVRDQFVESISHAVLCEMEDSDAGALPLDWSMF